MSYQDIINLPRHISKNRKHMSNYDRAAQFAPFSALTGYDASINEAKRLTETQKELSEVDLFELDQKLKIIEEHIKEKPTVRIKHFIPDGKKDGGKYLWEDITIRHIDLVNRLIMTTDKRKFALDYIIEIEGEIFNY